MSAGSTAIDRSAGGEPPHGLRIGIAWAVFVIIVAPLVIFVLGPHIPPHDMSVQSSDQHTVNVVLTSLTVPVFGLIWVYFGYAIAFFRQPEGDTIVDEPPIASHPKIQIAWLAITSVLVLSLAGYGTVGLLGSSHGAGGGQGPSPLATPPASTRPLQVQVIGQQWMWTYRYPSYGGVETATLELPANRWVELHVTSLDVVHSFWAYELGIKADAVPGADNVAFLDATHTGTFQVRCAELCGVWHGHMNAYGKIVAPSDFQSWIAARQTQYAAITKTLPPYALTYYPSPIRRG